MADRYDVVMIQAPYPYRHAAVDGSALETAIAKAGAENVAGIYRRTGRADLLPAPSLAPPAYFAHVIREICDKHGVLFSFVMKCFPAPDGPASTSGLEHYSGCERPADRSR